MKYADCPSTEAEVTIRGSLAATWELVSDINPSTRFSSEVQAVEWAEGHGGKQLVEDGGS